MVYACAMRRLAVVLLLLGAPVHAEGLADAQALLAQGRPADARTLLERTAADPALRGESLVLLTRACNAQEDYENGVRYGKEAVELRPEDGAAHFEYAQALRIKMSKVAKIKAMLSLSTYKKELARSLELDPRNVDAREEQIGFLLNAPGFAGGDVSEARRKAGELVEVDWRSGKQWLANVEIHEEKDDAAVPILREILGRYPDDLQTRFRLAYALQKLGRYEEADEEFAILGGNADPRVALHARYQRARTRVLGQFDQQTAIELLREYIADFPANAQGMPPVAAAWRRMGNAHAQLGQTDQARQAFEKSLALENSADTRKELEALSRR